jgi:nucleoside-diphosphate-sugar epimerase
MNAIVTGAGGFVGRVLVSQLDSPRALGLAAGDWASRIDAAEFRGAMVYHLAARVHGTGSDSEQAFLHDNVTKTEVLARAAASRGARGFVFVSTAKVNGEESGEVPFHATDPPDPRDAYARSKWAAEQALAVIASETGLSVTVVRPPLVYGRGAKANLRLLLRLCDSPWPLPFAALRNRRSFIEVRDLARLLRACEPPALGRTMTFMAAHPQPVSTAELVAALRRKLGRAPRLFAMPPDALEAAAALVGRRDTMLRLTRSLVVDAGETERLLGWRAQAGFEAAVDEVVAGYREEAPH